MPEPQSHAARAAKGASILVGSQAVILGFQFLGDVVLARLLAPADFGLVAMVLSVTSFAMQFKDFGLSAATIQSPTLTNRQASNLFWCNVAVSTLMAVAFAAAGPAIQAAYHRPGLAAITAGLSLTFLLAGLGVQHQAQLTRQMRFGAVSRSQLVGVVAGYAAAAAGAAAGLHHWALVLLQVVRQGVATAALWSSHRWIPERPARRQGTWRLLRFGSALAGFDAVNYFSRNADKMIVGRRFGEVELGHYNRAYQFLLLPVAQIRGPVSAAGMPLLSSLQARPDEYRRLYLGMINLVASVALPVLCWLAATSFDLTLALFGAKWAPSAAYFRLLALAGLVQPTVGMLGLLLVTLGRGDRYFRWGCWHSGLMVASFFAGLPWGVAGVALAYAAANAVAAPLSAWYCTRDSAVSARDFLAVHWVPGLFALLGAAACLAIARATATWPLWPRLAASSLAFAAAYLSQFALLRRRLDEVRGLVQTLLRRKAPAHATAG